MLVDFDSCTISGTSITMVPFENYPIDEKNEYKIILFYGFNTSNNHGI